MKTIGIKLADGTFYPILEEGSAKTYQLDLTTVKDGQTKVQIDLYRSSTGTMEDAEYVDTLEVSNLVPHPNGEADLHLSVGLNENNELDAKVVDEETGKESETSVTLVSRTLAERAEPTNFELSETEPEVIDAAEPESLPEDILPVEDFAEPVEEPAAEITEPSNPDDSLADFTFADFTDDNANEEEAPAEEVTETVEALPFSFDNEIAAQEAEEAAAAEVIEEAPVADDPFNFDADSISEPAPAVDDLAFETVSDEGAADNLMSEPLPEMSDDIFNIPEETTETVSEEPVSESFDLPDFDTPVLTDSSLSEGTAETAGLTGYFDDPAFKEDPVFTDADLTSNNEVKFDTSALDNSLSEGNTSYSSAPAMDFSDLYDKETLNGETSMYDDSDNEEKKTHIPMIICIICAIICVVATALVLFVVPSKYNLLNKSEETVIEQPAPAPVVEEPAPVVEEPAAPVAVEDQIVVAPEPEVVVPVPAPAPEPEKKKDVKYRIRWGDTLWDISDAYYKNPWRYPKIAKYNKIRNPDLIISGTDILIPVE